MCDSNVHLHLYINELYLFVQNPGKEV